MGRPAQKRCAICTTPIKYKWILCNACWNQWSVEIIRDDNNNRQIICAPWIRALIEEEWEYFLRELRDQAHDLTSFEELTGGRN